MSNYIYNLGVSIERALGQVPSAQPAQVAAYWTLREFWIDEFNHLLAVIDGYQARLEKMQAAYKEHSYQVGREEYLDEFGYPRQNVRDTTSPPDRRRVAGDARKALTALADRAYDLGIATPVDYQDFLDRVQIEG